jgi:hypothetical protein
MLDNCPETSAQWQGVAHEDSPLLITFLWERMSSAGQLHCIGCRQIQWVDPDYRSTFDVFIRHQGQHVPIVDPSGQLMHQQLALIPQDSCVLLFPYNPEGELMGVLLHSLDDIHILASDTGDRHQATESNLSFVLDILAQHDPIARVGSFLKWRRPQGEDAVVRAQANGYLPGNKRDLPTGPPATVNAGIAEFVVNADEHRQVKIAAS